MIRHRSSARISSINPLISDVPASHRRKQVLFERRVTRGRCPSVEPARILVHANQVSNRLINRTLYFSATGLIRADEEILAPIDECQVNVAQLFRYFRCFRRNDTILIPVVIDPRLFAERVVAAGNRDLAVLYLVAAKRRHRVAGEVDRESLDRIACRYNAAAAAAAWRAFHIRHRRDRQPVFAKLVEREIVADALL